MDGNDDDKGEGRFDGPAYTLLHSPPPQETRNYRRGTKG